MIKRPRRLNYAVNKISPKSGSKIKNAIASYKRLQKRLAFEGETKWLSNALKIAKAKLDKYQINLNKI
ncbi:MAG: hypothetical protein LBF15_05900 [Candidatus Peribacteria bacterium]|jgi:hypothetical protein|nr:hypothetical protein [Candidatus Peribacteria bacterium]